LTETVATNLADESSIETATLCPNSQVGGTASGGEHDFAERIATLEQVVVCANQNIPCKIADNAK
jgi:hypothetical protein